MNKPDITPFNNLYPNLGTDPVPVEVMTSPEYFEIEREKIFKKSWLNVGRVDDIPERGDYMVKDLAILQTSLIIVNGQDGDIRALHNVCLHRGNQVASDCGNAVGFSCGYHGWTYDTTGDLAFCPDEEQFFNLKKSNLGLRAAHCEVWAGFIFINVAEQPEQSLEGYLGELGQQLKAFPFHEMEAITCVQAEINVNWKVSIDAFQEAYHVPVVHKNSAGDLVDAKHDPYMHVQSIRLHGLHRALTVPVDPNYNPESRPPAEALSFKLATALWLQEGSREQEFMPGTNLGKQRYCLFDINVLFPNLFIDVANGWFFTYHFWPVAVDKTLWQWRFYMFPPKNPAEAISHEYAKASLRDLLREDLSTLETTQKGLMSGVIQEVQFSDQEVALRHQYKVVDGLVKG